MRTGIIYLIRNCITGRIYIGQTIRPLNVRWNRHKKDARRGSENPLHRAIRKYGVENFTVEELCEVPDEWLNAVEVGFVKLLGTFGNGYNATLGGEGFGSGEDHPLFGKPRHEEVRKKISQTRIRLDIKHSEETLAKMKGRKHSEERKANIKLAVKGKQTGEKNGFFGKKHSDEFKEWQRARVLGRKLSEEHKARISESHIRRRALKELELHEKAS